MSKTREAGIPSIRCWILCVLLALGLVLAGCGAGETPGADALSEEEQDTNAGQVMLPSASEVIAEAEREAGEAGEAGEPGEEDPFAGEEAEEPMDSQGTDSIPGAGPGGTGGSTRGGAGGDAGPGVTGTEPTLEDLLKAANRNGKPVLKKRVLPEIYDPNQTYDIYTLVEYSIDDIGSEFTATVSAEYDFSEYEVHCTVGRTEQLVILNTYYNVIYDRTGNMGDDAQEIVQMAVEQDDWKEIGE